jgi:nitric oxide reductase
MPHHRAVCLPACLPRNSPQDYKLLSDNVAVRSSGSSSARDAAAAQEALTTCMEHLVSVKEKHPQTDLISDVIQQQVGTVCQGGQQLVHANPCVP